MLNDLRHAVRTLRHAKGWTVVVVLSLALGIGANTALFSVVNALFITKLPARDPDGLVRLRGVGRNQMALRRSDYGPSLPYGGREVRTTFSYPMFRQFVADNRTMSDLFACAPYGSVNVLADGRADTARAFLTTGNYYQVLGLSASRGRTIVPSDEQPDAPPVAVISPKYFRTRFATDPSAIGRTIRVKDVPVTIVGVIAPDLIDAQQAVREGPDIALPLALEARLTPTATAGRNEGPRVSQATDWWLQVMGRLKPGATTAQVQANLGGVFQATARAGFDTHIASLPEDERNTSTLRDRVSVPELLVDSGSRGFYDVPASDRTAMSVLGIVVVLVLLIVCANVANLLLSRATTRQREISVRLSLGATRARLVRQLLTESLMLSTIGGALGLAVAYWGRAVLPVTAAHTAPIDARVLSFTLAATMVTGILFGITPALRATGMKASSMLKESSRTFAAGRSAVGTSLLVAQLAVSLALLVAAGLFLRTLHNLRSVDAGFDPQNLAIFRVTAELKHYDTTRALALYDRMLERLRAIAGVKSAAIASVPLLAGSVSSTDLMVAGRSYAPGERHDINRLVVSPSFFDTMGMRIVAGRGVTERDHRTAPKVVVINEAAVRTFFPHENPLGRRVGTSVETANQMEIVGVLRDAKYDNVRDPAPPTEYVPMQQAALPTAIFHVRTAGDPLAALGPIRDAIREVDPDLPLMNVTTQVEQMDKQLVQEKAFALVYTSFAVLAVLLASIGLFGVMSYSVARRTNEIGIRMALGARRPDVLRLVMSESMRLVVLGLVIGLGLALAAGRLLTTLLFGLDAADRPTIVAALALMTVVTAVAGYLPARRAARVDPIIALHYE